MGVSKARDKVLAKPGSEVQGKAQDKVLAKPGAGDPAWQVISSCRFKNIVFKRDGAFEKISQKTY